DYYCHSYDSFLSAHVF
nr:immunoglobulin light chain junction region [Macaca mulatta]MOV98347.1 immunoglobulin light chain junction region [Macaca mulatta]MOW00373.1 immunoglobulin light chain junction region [Macaca mulatta]